MRRLTPETIQALAGELYEYQLDDDAAASVAHMVGAMAVYSRRLDTLDLGGLQPPFGYPVLIAQAQRVRDRGDAK